MVLSVQDFAGAAMGAMFRQIGETSGIPAFLEFVQFISRRSRSSRARLSMTRIFSTPERNVRHGHREFTGKKHGGESFAHFAAHLVFDSAARGALFALAAMQRRAHLAYQTVHSGDREVDVHRKSRAQMFDHLIAFVGLGFEQELVDDGGGISLFAQAGGGFLQGLGPMRFLSGGDCRIRRTADRWLTK